MRASEPTILERQHLDFGNRKIYLPFTKSQEPQEVPMLPDLVEPVRLIANQLPNQTDRVFVGWDGNPWTRKQVLDAIVWWAKMQGIERHVTPRVVRATV